MQTDDISKASIKRDEPKSWPRSFQGNAPLETGHFWLNKFDPISCKKTFADNSFPQHMMK